jgi:hypothetical protein
MKGRVDIQPTIEHQRNAFEIQDVAGFIWVGAQTVLCKQKLCLSDRSISVKGKY